MLTFGHVYLQFQTSHTKTMGGYSCSPCQTFSHLPTIEAQQYLQEHLSFTRHKWKQLWKVGGDATRPKGCPIHAWNSLVKYQKCPIAKHESKQMREVHVMVNNPWKMGQMSLAHSMSLDVEQCQSQIISIYGIVHGIKCLT